MASDKRDSERVEFLGALHGEVTVFQPAAICQMSHGGMQVETAFPLQLDSLHDFRLTLGERSVVVKGRIGSRLADIIEGFEVTAADQGRSRLIGTVADRSELRSVLTRIEDFGIDLASLTTSSTGEVADSVDVDRRP